LLDFDRDIGDAGCALDAPGFDVAGLPADRGADRAIDGGGVEAAVGGTVVERKANGRDGLRGAVGRQAESVKGDETVAPLPGLADMDTCECGTSAEVRIEPLQNSLRKTLIGRTPVQEMAVHLDCIRNYGAAAQRYTTTVRGWEPGRKRGDARVFPRRLSEGDGAVQIQPVVMRINTQN